MKRLSLTLISFLFSIALMSAQAVTERLLTIENIQPTDIDSAGFVQQIIDLEQSNVQIELESQQWIDISGDLTQSSATNEFTWQLAWQRKTPKAVIKIPALRRTESGVQILQQVTLKISSDDRNLITRAKPEYPANSVLRSGNWYKIGVTQRGIHKIDAAFLSNLGIDIASLNANNIRIYGNGGQVMTEMPDDSEPNDLVQNAIYVSASGSTFTSSDYILFYAPGLVKWQYDDLVGYYHTQNYYSDTAYYFLNVDLGAGLRISESEVGGTPDTTFSQFDDYVVIDQDSFYHSSAGRIWWSHQMFSDAASTLQKSVTLQLTDPVGPIDIDYQFGTTVPVGGSKMRLTRAGSLLAEVPFSSFIQYDDVKIVDGTLSTSTDSRTIALQLQFVPAGSGRGLLDYIRVKGPSRINLSGQSQLSFRNQASSMYFGGPIAYRLINAGSSIKVWDVTHPLRPIARPISLSGSTATVQTEGAGINEMIAFDGSNFYQPVYSGPVENQNLHALGPADFIIITVDSFLPAAEELAQLHAEVDGISTHIVTTKQIYNEFSSGAQDIAGIRNFLRMFYDRASTPEQVPANVLLLGAASYDYKDRTINNTNFVPNFHTYNSGNFGGDIFAAFSTDDYYVLLDSAEVLQAGPAALYDMGIGRIPAKSNAEALQVVEKIRNYLSPQSFGPWKNSSLFVADNADGAGNFPRDCDWIVDSLMLYSPVLNNHKLYADMYERVSGGSGDTYPKVADELNSHIYSGVFLINYSGHGNPQRLAEENILTKPQIASYRNIDKLPIVITGTCDFGRYDHPELSSGGVELFLKPDGGAIASLTTTQQVYSGSSTQMISRYIPNQFNKIDGEIPTMGEALIRAKNSSGGSHTNNLKYVLLGDPALKPAIPRLEVTTDSILVYSSETETSLSDTLSALGNYILFGSVKDAAGMVRSDFDGTVYVTIFDKPQTNPISNFYPSYTEFVTQNSVVYKGQVSVQEGKFSINMIIPKDLNYEFGKGKISYYASNEYIDGAGSDTNIVVGGFAEYIREDNEPPVVKPYIDDEQFRDGGVTGPDPLLYVKLYDDNGINISGSSIGHDLIAILDGDATNPYILNNYYFTMPDDIRNGYVYFPMSNLSEGWHEIEVRAWDVYNNSGSGTVRFQVRNKEEAFISEVYTYPNPTSESQTWFVVQHNLKNEQVKITIDIFNTAGARVKSIEKTLNPDANRIEIPWNTTDESGMQVAPGVYPFRVVLTGTENKQDIQYNKVVIIR